MLLRVMVSRRLRLGSKGDIVVDQCLNDPMVRMWLWTDRVAERTRGLPHSFDWIEVASIQVTVLEFNLVLI